MDRRILLIGLACVLAGTRVGPSLAQPSLRRLEQTVPRAPDECTVSNAQEVAAAAQAVERWAAEQTWGRRAPSSDRVVETIRQLVDAKHRVDRCVDEVLGLRGRFVLLPAGEPRREKLRQYLRTTSQLIDLSGRMRYLLRDAIDQAAYYLTAYPSQLDALIDLLLAERVSIGASVMSYMLFDPPPESGVKPFPDEVKRKVLELIAATKQTDLLLPIADFIEKENPPPALLLDAADVLLQIGLPQEPLPGQDAPPPPITAKPLHRRLSALDPGQLSPDLGHRRQRLLRELEDRLRYGIRGDVYQRGNLRLRSGDWLLMRNPSPYNSFTDLAPGLFTHVGIVTVQTDPQGVRRFVIVDLPERGDHVPATTVGAYLPRTLHYFFLRHRDPEVQRKMGEAAASIIGNETQFDLTFRTDRVLALKGKPLRGQRINTYCAGFLLVCAQQTGAPRSEFFPIPEYVAGGHCRENLAKLGISIGEDFVSPTGAVFSPHLQLVGRREPMYSPGREVQEFIYDSFAQAMVDKRLTPSPNAYQALRQKLAELSKYNPWLARVLAKTHNVSQHMDLEAAAKAAAVIETLDTIAEGSRDGFLEARQAFLAGPVDQLAGRGFSAEEIERIKRYRARHRALFDRWLQGSLSPRQLRMELVRYYKQQGVQALNRRFFQGAE